MICPKCKSTMELLTYEGVEVDRCIGCKGLWIDGGEMEALRIRKAATHIDIGEPSSATEVRERDKFACPRCSGGMVRMVDLNQSHIWYEKCSSCGGLFYDAGEFRDLSENTIWDFFKDLFTPERK
ncbi:MAG: zf-TFIIB domain-containing protein [Gammaproteobacteria bacterium]|nr:zf-TFIIB domain-containing protein [Gammaproteobacteria bacterium]